MTDTLIHRLHMTVALMSLPLLLTIKGTILSGAIRWLGVLHFFRIRPNSAATSSITTRSTHQLERVITLTIQLRATLVEWVVLLLGCALVVNEPGRAG
jgi:hypothetical protein